MVLRLCSRSPIFIHALERFTDSSLRLDTTARRMVNNVFALFSGFNETAIRYRYQPVEIARVAFAAADFLTSFPHRQVPLMSIRTG